MTNYLFLYGTLLPYLAPSVIAPVVAKLRRVGEASVRGALYHLGGFPGAILDEGADGHIHGTVFELPGDEGVLSALDEYEDYDPQNVEQSQFVRRLHPVALASGEEMRCWIYVYNREVGSAARILSGRYLQP